MFCQYTILFFCKSTKFFLPFSLDFLLFNSMIVRVHRKECDGKRRPGKSLLRLEDNNSRIKFRKIETVDIYYILPLKQLEQF